MRSRAGVAILVALVASLLISATPASGSVTNQLCDTSDLLIIHNDSLGSLPADLAQQPRLGAIDVHNLTDPLPSVEQLLAYDAVLLMPNGPLPSRAVLGDRLADYADAGGAVLMAAFSNSSFWGLQGRWAADGYGPFDNSSSSDSATVTLGSHARNHPLLDSVTELGAKLRSTVGVLAGAEVIARASDGAPYLVHKGRALR